MGKVDKSLEIIPLSNEKVNIIRAAIIALIV